ncbi:hypothetical protein PHMEG_00022438 [Phytophthora megakarya]|uniref:Uncharacterized protein n=1 Tax=Phytophthora megakarya TaxID=4795 RepID=A0A225VIR5_9STRA|nr:hypothetical protein PHMEG_00022438 [Phytophthora megakarya]
MVTTRSRSRQVDHVDDPADHLTIETNDEDPELKRLKDYLRGDLLNYTRKEVKKIAKGRPIRFRLKGRSLSFGDAYPGTY